MVSQSEELLRNKLGIKPGMRLYFERAPADVFAELGDIDDDTTTVVHDAKLANYFHYFITTRAQLKPIVEALPHLKAPGQIIWISWPKKSSKVMTDITEEYLRSMFLPIGLTGSKKCDVSDSYLGLKFLWRTPN